MKKSLKQITPRPLWNLASNTYWDWRNRGRHVWAQKIGASWRENARQLETYHDLYRGKRCFVIGNGPSLRQMDLSPLKGE